MHIVIYGKNSIIGFKEVLEKHKKCQYTIVCNENVKVFEISLNNFKTCLSDYSGF